MKTFMLTLVGLLLWLVSPVCLASESIILLEKLTQCSHISSADERLVCFDGLLKKELTSKASVNEVPTAILAVQTEQSKAIDNFAKGHIKKTSAQQGLKSISSKVTKLKTLIRGQWLISLENGQQWQQKDTKKFKLKKDDIVRLKKGAMGSVYLYIEGGHRNIRVKRLK